MTDDYNTVHKKRWELSLDWIAPYAEKAERILELGGSTEFTKSICQRWPGKLQTFYEGDLRDGFLMNPGIDLILAMELIEHLSDKETSGIQAEWRGSGTRNLLTSCFESLKPGGILFLTTPNACSITTIHHALNLGPPMLYRPHVREYSPYELDEMVRNAGFEIIRRETLDVWRNAIGDRAHKRIARFIDDENYPTDLRGEDIFCLAKRPDGKPNLPLYDMPAVRE